MATDATGTRSVHNTLTGTTVDTVTLQGYWGAVEVVNREASGGTSLWITVGHEDLDPSTPVAAANETFEVPAGLAILVDLPNGATVKARVKVLGDGNDYSVIGHNHA